jgi:hypothetical protein
MYLRRWLTVAFCWRPEFGIVTSVEQSLSRHNSVLCNYETRASCAPRVEHKMARKSDMYDLRSFVEDTLEFYNILLDENGRYSDGTQLSPIDENHIRKMRPIARDILKNHILENAHKHVYVKAAWRML